MKYSLLCFFVFSNLIYFQTAAQSEKQLSIIKNFKVLLQNNDAKAIAANVKYPFQRKYPLPAIQNKADFIQNYTSIFDDFLRNKIINSSTEKDWTAVSQNRITLESGLLWLDHKGRIKSINYLPKKGHKSYRKLLRLDKKSLHKSVHKYWEPVLSWQTELYKIRIDKESPYSYRLTLWSSDQSVDSTPNLVIDGGQKEYEGLQGHQHFVFSKNNKEYICRIIKSIPYPAKSFLIQEQQSITYLSNIP